MLHGNAIFLQIHDLSDEDAREYDHKQQNRYSPQVSLGHLPMNYSYSSGRFQKYMQISRKSLKLTLPAGGGGGTRFYGQNGFMDIWVFLNYVKSPLGPKLLHYITLLSRITLPDHVVILYIAELVLNYFLRYVISCAVAKHTMCTLNHITKMLSNFFTGYVIIITLQIGSELIM